MKLPNGDKATIDPRKVTEYSLNPVGLDHPDRGKRAQVGDMLYTGK
jgi:hypothetical protein